MVRGHYGEYKVLVDGNVVVDGGKLAALGILPKGREVVDEVRKRLRGLNRSISNDCCFSCR